MAMAGRAAEHALWAKGLGAIAGVDEAGRGPLAGPVVAAACIVPAHVKLDGVDDSKKTTEATRERLFAEITAHPDVLFCIVEADHVEIDRVNVLQATFAAMTRAVKGLRRPPDHVMIDGPYVPPLLQQDAAFSTEAVVKGDSKVYSIACASVLAKVHRDRLMRDMDTKYPLYGFAQHKGYPTLAHRTAVFKHGPCKIHRTSFAPVKNAILARKAVVDSNTKALAGKAKASGPKPDSRKRKRAAPPKRQQQQKQQQRRRGTRTSPRLRALQK